MDQAANRKYDIEELATLAGVPRRTVRYYIQLGLVDRPVGETRAAYYERRHLEQLLTVVRYSVSGVSLERIASLLRAPDAASPVAAVVAGTVEVRSHLALADGVELVLEPGRAGLSPEQVRRLYRETLALYRRVLKEDDDGR